ncbi:MAG: hypothetical protein AB1439_03060 [candidate division FCPU426 bacterium]
MNESRKTAARAVAGALCVMFAGVLTASARTEKPTVVVEDFFRLLSQKQYAEAAELLSSADLQNLESLRKKTAKAGKRTQAVPDIETVLSDLFFLMFSDENKKMMKKAQDGETILPRRIHFFVPGQHYIVGRYAVVFTRETYELAPELTGPVRDDPRKLWIDPTNELSKVRDEAYFKQWWVWEGDRLTMPGVVWLVKENRIWRIDLLSGVVPRESFRKILRWHFGREILEEKKKAETPPAARPAK